LVHYLLHWISGVQVSGLSIRDGQVFSLSVTYLLEVSTSLDIIQTGCRATLEFVFLDCQQNPLQNFVDLKWIGADFKTL